MCYYFSIGYQSVWTNVASQIIKEGDPDTSFSVVGARSIKFCQESFFKCRYVFVFLAIRFMHARYGVIEFAGSSSLSLDYMQ